MLNNRYNISTINKINNKFKRKLTISLLHSGTEQTFKRIPLIISMHQLTARLSSTLSSYGITNSALYNNNNLGSHLFNNKIDKFDKYKIDPRRFDAFYI